MKKSFVELITLRFMTIRRLKMEQYLQYNYDDGSLFISAEKPANVFSRSSVDILSIDGIGLNRSTQMLLSSTSQIHYDLEKAGVEPAILGNTSIISFATVLVLQSIENNVYSNAFGNVLHLLQYENDKVSDIFINSYNTHVLKDVSIAYTRNNGEQIPYGDMNDYHLINAFAKAFKEQFINDDNSIFDAIKSTTSGVDAQMIAISVLFEHKQYSMEDKVYYLYCEILRRVAA